ncbi:hypothetical protein L1987_34827 [Smallanthus sonchifolius]|uniref:Uncharacterized protein n=1 Tax=Smallanthus sonchifolius TaxID=185202 RepID=A0ACB9HVR2_9ASTR|nr:hypothetical protein L1987_34827 [Smallanthus sonchifolius]
MVDRVLYSFVMYPHNYGFVLRTLCEGNDPLDVLVIMQEQILPGCFLCAKAIGFMPMIDQREKDDKIIAVCADDHEKNENKEVVVNEFLLAVEAIEVVKRSIRMPKDNQLDSMPIQKPATNGPYSINGVSAVGAFYELLSQSSLSDGIQMKKKPVAPFELCPILKTLYKILIKR